MGLKQQSPTFRTSQTTVVCRPSAGNDGLKCLTFGLAKAGPINGGSYYLYTSVFFLDLKKY